jgi:hypothetical protein
MSAESLSDGMQAAEMAANGWQCVRVEDVRSGECIAIELDNVKIGVARVATVRHRSGAATVGLSFESQPDHYTEIFKGQPVWVRPAAWF